MNSSGAFGEFEKRIDDSIEVSDGDVVSVITEIKDQYGFSYRCVTLELKVEGQEIVEVEHSFEQTEF